MTEFDYGRLLNQARWVKKSPKERGVLSTGEKLAVAIILNRADWLKEMRYSMTDAIAQLGPDWVMTLPKIADELDALP